MAAKENWVIDNQEKMDTHTIRGIADLETFSFQVQRIKDMYSGKEVIKITSFYDGVEYGTIVSKVAQLSTEIAQLSDVGINLSRSQFIELARTINDNFYYFNPQIGDGLENDISDRLLKEVLRFYKRYIKEENIPNQKGYYNITVDAFKNEYEESIFKRYNIADIKEALRIRNVTRCNANRNDFAIKAGKTNKRYISFDAAIIDKVK